MVEPLIIYPSSCLIGRLVQAQPALGSKNSMVINVPRTRKGSLSLNTLELLKLNREKLDEMTLSLYKKGLSFNDIRSFLDEMFDTSISPSTISELTKTFF